MTILSETTCRVLTPTGGVLLFVAVILLIIMLVGIGSNSKHVRIVFAFLIAFLACFVAAMICSKPHREIKAIISDDYPATSLHDKYDVKYQDGEIWVLVEKEPITEEDEG